VQCSLPTTKERQRERERESEEGGSAWRFCLGLRNARVAEGKGPRVFARLLQCYLFRFRVCSSHVDKRDKLRAPFPESEREDRVDP